MGIAVVVDEIQATLIAFRSLDGIATIRLRIETVAEVMQAQAVRVLGTLVQGIQKFSNVNFRNFSCGKFGKFIQRRIFFLISLSGLKYLLVVIENERK